MLYQPAFEGTISNWTHKFIRQQHWRIRITCPTWDDALQETRMVFVMCQQRYCDTGKCNNMAHFMSLYMRSVINRFHRLAMKDEKVRRIEHGFMDIEDVPEDWVQETENAGFLNVLLQQAPKEVAMVVSLFTDAPTDLLEIVRGKKRTSDMGMSKRLVKLLGLPDDCDPLGATREFLQGACV